MTQVHEPYRTGRETKFEGRWLRLETITYVDEQGEERSWESAPRQCGGTAVQMIARLQPSGRYILIEQYRPPVDAVVLEFPAGLVDPNEDAATTAVRELYEETGYTGKVEWLGEPALNSPGMTSEAVCLALLSVAETDPINQNPQPKLDDGEFIRTFLVDEAHMASFLTARQALGRRLDSRLVAYFLRAGLRW